MILQALHQLAVQEDLMADPDYEPKPVAWLVRVGPKGEFLGIQGTHTVPQVPAKGKKKSRPEPKTFSLPREKAVTSGDRAFLLFGKAEYVLGQDPDGERPPEKLASRFALFNECVKQCLGATKDKGVDAVSLLLARWADPQQRPPLPENCASNDLFAFIFSEDVDTLISSRPMVREYWKGLRGADVTTSGSTSRCLVSGDLIKGSVGNFPPLKKVPGGTTSGVGLVSFNSPAFESYGWDKNENAPISRGSAEACSTALNRLLHPAPDQLKSRLKRQNLRLSADTVVCYWSTGKTASDFCSVFAGLLEGNPDEVAELYRSVWKGRQHIIDDVSAFYALTLTGTQGRAIVRGWFETTVREVADHLAQHFSDLDLVRNCPAPKERGHPPQFPLRLLLESLAVFGDAESIPAHLAEALLESAVRGVPYPLSLLQKAIERTRAEMGHSEWKDLNRRDARVALIKAVLNRRRRLHPQTTQYLEVRRDMDPKHDNPGYVLGRLMAVLERLQQEAIGDPNASVVDRFFSGASAAPKSVFFRLMKNARHHARKGKDGEKAGFVFLLERLLDEHADRFDPKQNGFPAHLSLEEQGLFILGYHQMRKWLWMPKEDRAQWEKDHADAPRAYQWNTSK